MLELSSKINLIIQKNDLDVYKVKKAANILAHYRFLNYVNDDDNKAEIEFVNKYPFVKCTNLRIILEQIEKLVKLQPLVDIYYQPEENEIETELFSNNEYIKEYEREDEYENEYEDDETENRTYFEDVILIIINRIKANRIPKIRVR